MISGFCCSNPSFKSQSSQITNSKKIITLATISSLSLQYQTLDTTGNEKMYRIRELAKIIKAPPGKLINEILFAAKGRFMIYFKENFYAFESIKKVIIPHEYANDYSKMILNRSLKPKLPLRELPIPDTADRDNVNRKIAVLLGHFNHGKTSLLDTMINVTNSEKTSDIVSEEKHAITQVEDSNVFIV
jgi:hypothetical protein